MRDLTEERPEPGDAPFPLDALRLAVAGRGTLPPAELRAFARRSGIPIARVRAALTSFADLAARAPLPRVCVGTSCFLHGATALAAQAGTRARPAFCLGYCGHSPALLDASERTHAPLRPETLDAALAGQGPRAPATDVRCLAPEAIVTRRIGRGDFSRLDDARADGAYQTLARALRGTPAQVLDAVERSGQRGRGGAAFSTGAKWRACARAPGPPRFVVANGDEGDPGAFVDRVLLERDPHGVLEGLALCAFAVGAARAVVFVRSEYPEAIARMERAVADAEAAGILGARVLGSAFELRVRVFRGLGSYVCGEETALLEALEGRRGEVRLRPPYPSERGLYGSPTVVNNVETLASVPWILERGPEAFAALGTPASRGSKALCFNAGFPRPGILEVPFGLSVRDAVEAAGLRCEPEALEVLLVGGPMGSVLRPEECDAPICYEAFAERGFDLGHGGLVAVPPGTELSALLLHLLEFMTGESCGKCVPCRTGSARALALARADWRGEAEAIERVLDVAESASLCAFGRSLPAPLRRLLALARAQASAR